MRKQARNNGSSREKKCGNPTRLVQARPAPSTSRPGSPPSRVGPASRSRSAEEAVSTGKPTRHQLSVLWPFGFFLALNAGFVNVVAFLHFGFSVANMTGNVTNIGVDLVALDRRGLYALGVVVVFVTGSTVSSLITGKSHKFRFSKRFGVVMFLESIVLFISGGLMLTEKHSGTSNFDYTTETPGFITVPFLLGFVLGLQNGMLTHLSGAVVRTTHVTGTLTDIGTELGDLLRATVFKTRKKFDPWKLKVLTLLLCSFFLGAVLGSLAIAHHFKWALVVAASAQLVFSGLYYYGRTRRLFQKAELTYQPSLKNLLFRISSTWFSDHQHAVPETGPEERHVQEGEGQQVRQKEAPPEDEDDDSFSSISSDSEQEEADAASTVHIWPATPSTS
eukprot:gb/GEZN01010046.1/.p1 GENE.gb/GEZN01010046.1/~~gb/GEZN01010046.1/.p1  ORF type:complete len:391 (+),score=43.93 gb/GEZN01010046.1/:55-1227(+)